MSRPRLLDLFCGAGGAAMGYHRAGFDVVGVDIAPQPHYPFEFFQRDVTEIMATAIEQRWIADNFDAIHASPPCQAWARCTKRKSDHPQLIEPTRALLKVRRLASPSKRQAGRKVASAAELVSLLHSEAKVL